MDCVLEFRNSYRPLGGRSLLHQVYSPIALVLFIGCVWVLIVGNPEGELSLIAIGQ